MSKISIKDLYKIEKVVTVKDEKTGNEADVCLRIISDSGREDAIRYANKEKAELAKKLEDKDSPEYFALKEQIKNSPVDTLELKIKIIKESLVGDEAYLALRADDKYKELDDGELSDSEDFQDAYLKERSKIADEYLEKLDKNENNLRKELMDLQLKSMLNSFFMHSFNEKILVHAIRDPEDSSKRLFDSVEKMKDNFFGDSYVQLIEKYYGLSGNKTENDIKN